MIVLRPPESLPVVRVNGKVPNSVFLAGSIDEGRAENWQQAIVEVLKPLNGIIFNPRREQWDESIVPVIENGAFYEQVHWEMTAIESSQVVVMYLHPGAKSPISLLELGLSVKDSKMIVCCPEGFWRKGTVDIVCERYGAIMTDNFEDFSRKIFAELKYRN